MKKISSYILSLPRSSKRITALLTDVLLCILSQFITFAIVIEKFNIASGIFFYSVLISLVIAIPVFWLFGIYYTVFRYFGSSTIYNILGSSIIYGLIYFIVIRIYYSDIFPLAFSIINPMLLFYIVISSRVLVNYILTGNYTFKFSNKKKNAIIYGAGSFGKQLLNTLENSPEFNIVGFLDDDQQLHKQSILGKKVYSPDKLITLVASKNISIAFMALSKISRSKRNSIAEKFYQYKVKVQTLPSYTEILDGRITISDIKDFDINDLLNRKEIKPDAKLLNKNINSKSILVTGAGGSIGSELSRQIVKLRPKKLILLELNEFALYKIYDQLSSLNLEINIIPLLANTQNQIKLMMIFETFKIDTVYHAAAYKHVPLVEENISEGVKNNIFSTLAVANACIAKKVSNLVLVSSDKAVRPTNIMGATKRLSELCVQGIYNNIKGKKPNFSIVRFGNVLESSGSVIPKFKEQIKAGGPVTLTDPNVTRYFMTITEAAQLVIQAGAMGKKSEIFVLDMGKSVKIINLIYKMVKLSGLSIKDDKNTKGDIEIKVIGLRPGEKLYEELLIGDNPKKTKHRKIYKTQDSFIPLPQLQKNLDKLNLLLDNNKIDEAKALISKLIPYNQSKLKTVDHIYKEKLKFKSR